MNVSQTSSNFTSYMMFNLSEEISKNNAWRSSTDGLNLTFNLRVDETNGAMSGSASGASISGALTGKQQPNIDVPVSTIGISIVMYSIIFLIGFFGNALVILVAYCNRSQQHSTHYCLVNLSIADLLLIIVCMPSAVLDLFSKEIWYLGSILCKVIPWLEYTVAYASILTIVSISIERSLAIASPLKAKRFFTSERLWLVVINIWVISTLTSIPIMITTNYTQGFHKKFGKLVNICVVDTRQEWTKIYLYISFILFYVIPCLSLFVLYGNVVYVIRNRNKKNLLLKMNTDENNLSTNTMSTQKSNIMYHRAASDQLYDRPNNTMQQLIVNGKSKNNHQEQSALDKTPTSTRNSTTGELEFKRVGSKKRKNSSFNRPINKSPHNLPQINQKQIIILLIIMMLSIFICLLPYRVFSLWMARASKQQLERLGAVNYYNLIAFCRVTFYINSALNPIFYHIISTKFQTAFKRFFRFSYRSSQQINSGKSSRKFSQFNRDECLSVNNTRLNNKI